MGTLGTVELRTEVYFSKFSFDKVLFDCTSLCNNHFFLNYEKNYFLKIKVTFKSSAKGRRGCNIMLRYGYVTKNQET